MKNRMSFRTLEIVAVTLAVSAMAASIIYWQMHSTDKVFASSTEEIAARKVGEEIVSLRKANTDVFKAENGQLKAKIYASPINYLDPKDKTYKPIDTSVHQASEATHDSFVDAGVYKATWFKDKPWDYKMSVGDSWIQYKALFDESSVLSIKIDKLNTGMKETITLKDASAPTKLQWTVTQSGSGIITPPPTAIDANKKEVKVVSYQVGDTLTYEVDTVGAVFPIEVDPTSITATNDNMIQNNNATYATARDATAGTYKDATQLYVGQGMTYYVWRSFATFAIPNMSTVTAASLFLYGGADFSTTNFEIYINTSSYSNPIVVGDFDLFAGRQTGTADTGTVLNNVWNSSSFSATWNQIDFNAAGLAVILGQKNTIFRMVMLSKEDYNNSAPTTEEWVRFNSSSNAGTEPYLSITYTLIPTVTTQSASGVTATSATFNGNITAIGEAGPTVRGFAYGTDSTLSTVIATTTDTTGQPFGTGAFTGTPSSALTCNTTYYSRAYATNSAGTGLGAISASFTTSACPPTVTTQSASSVGITTATLNGNITATGGANATVRGFAWGTNATLSGGDTATTTDTVGQPFGTGAFTNTTITFACGTTYYSRAYATNSAGTGLGAISASFTTSACTPTVTTQSASSVGKTTATLNGNITNIGAFAPTVRGFAYGTDPTLAAVIATTTDTVGQPFGIGAFTNTSITFACNTTYYSRAYATNSTGTGLGAISASFTTTACAPTVTTQPASSVTATSATFNGNITATGGTGPTVRGFAYGTDPTLATVIATTTDVVGQPFGTGAFTGVPSPALTCNTTYYSRAYATNSGGTGLGAVSASFLTLPCVPTVTSQNPTNKANTSVTGNGTVTDTGGAAITTRGFKYGVTQADTFDVHENGSFGAAAFALAITGLVHDTTYYVRSYVTNSAGTSYGDYKSFITTISSDPVIFGSDVIFNKNVIVK